MIDPTSMRAAKVYDFLQRKESTVRVDTVQDALRLMRQWRAYAERLETLHAVAVAQWQSSETLRQIAEEELARLRGT